MPNASFAWFVSSIIAAFEPSTSSMGAPKASSCSVNRANAAIEACSIKATWAHSWARRARVTDEPQVTR